MGPTTLTKWGKNKKNTQLHQMQIFEKEKKKKFFRAARGKKLVTNWKKIRIFSSFVETM